MASSTASRPWAMCSAISAAARFASRRHIASTMRWWKVSDRSISAAPNVRNAWNTSGMSTVRASIAASRWWRAAARTPSWNRRFASWSSRTPSTASMSTVRRTSPNASAAATSSPSSASGGPLGGDLDGVGLEADAQPVEVDDLGGRERPHHRAPVALADDESLGLEHPQRLAHRRARQPELLGDALLDQPVPRRVAVLDDRGAHLGVGVGGADGVGRRAHVALSLLASAS